MSNNLDPSRILKLITISQALSPDKKLWWQSNLPNMNEFQKAKFVQILEEEVKAINENLKEKIEIKKRYTHKKVRALYHYAEEQIQKNEEIDLALLSKQLENA